MSFFFHETFSNGDKIYQQIYVPEFITYSLYKTIAFIAWLLYFLATRRLPWFPILIQ